MSQSRSTARSAYLSEVVDRRAEAIASRENRSLSNVIENSVTVFTLFEKEARDALLDIARNDPDVAAKFKELTRSMMFALARERVLAAHRDFADGGPVDDDMVAEEEAGIVQSRL